MNKFVKFARNVVGVITDSTPHNGSTSVQVRYHNGIKVTHTNVEKRALTEITAAEFELAVRKKGDTAMIQYLLSTEIEVIVWHTDLNDLPACGEKCLVFKNGDYGSEGGAVWTGQQWRMKDGFRYDKGWIKGWAYEPKGPNGKA